MKRLGLWCMATVFWSLATDVHASGDGPEILESKGKKDGVVVLWPRVVPPTDDATIEALAGRLQERLAGAAAQVVEPRAMDVRPSPERVCPRSGCRGASVGLMLGHQDGGCVAMALVGPAGAEPRQMVPVAGQVEMMDDRMPFRQAPEGRVIIKEFVPCGQLETAFDDALIAELIRAYRDG